MKSREILRRLVRRFGLLLLLTLIGGIAGAAYGALKTPTYTAKAYVVAVPTGAQGDPISALNFAIAARDLILHSNQHRRLVLTLPALEKRVARLQTKLHRQRSLEPLHASKLRSADSENTPERTEVTRANTH